MSSINKNNVIAKCEYNDCGFEWEISKRNLYYKVRRHGFAICNECAIKKRSSNPEYRSKQSNAANKRWTCPRERKLQSFLMEEVLNRPEVKQKLLDAWKNPVIREARLKAISNNIQSEATKQKMSQSAIKGWIKRRGNSA